MSCLTYKNRVIIPQILRQYVLINLLHEDHPSIIRIKASARGNKFWYNNNIDKDIENKVCNCCQINSNNHLLHCILGHGLQANVVR